MFECDPDKSVRTLRWLENRWWAVIREARFAGVLAMSLGVPANMTGRGYCNATLDEVARSLGMCVVDNALVGDGRR
jgi:hypothetical protein